MMNILLFPVKLAAKIVLYVLSIVFMLLAMVFRAISILLKRPCLFLGALGGASWVLILIIFLCNEDSPMTVTVLVHSFFSCVVCLLTPLLLSLLSKGLEKLIGLIHDLAAQVNLF